jgi:ferrous-iron efflux pump FieF
LKNEYAFWVKVASRASLVAVSVMIAIKIYAWYVTQSSSMLATLMDSVFDFGATVINFIVIRYSLAPPDDDHRFGHGKAEALVGLIQVAFICGASILLLLHSFGQIGRPSTSVNLDIGIYVTIATILITFALVSFQNYALNKANSTAVKAERLHYKGDLLMNLGVLLALVLTQLGYTNVDPIVAMFIAGYLLWSGWQIARESVDALMDKAMSNDDERRIADIALQPDDVQGVHDIRTRQSGGTIFIQLHLELDDDLSLRRVHAAGLEVEQALEKAYPLSEVLIHFDPISLVNKQRKKVAFPAPN